MAGKKLAGNVYVNGTLYEAGSTPPADVADQITNPKLWGVVGGKGNKTDAHEADDDK